MDTLLGDLRYALRQLRRSPGFTLAGVLTLALGIGANTAIFSVVDGVLLRPLPFSEPDRLVMAWGYHRVIGRETVSLPDYLDWRSAAGFEQLAAVAQGPFTLSGAGEPEVVRGAFATVDFFRTLGVAPAVGRDFLPEEGSKSAPKVAILSHGFWMRRFGGRADVMGRPLTSGGQPYTVVGVAPEGLRWPDAVDVWSPLATDSVLPRRGDFLTVVGRLRPGVSLEQAQAAVSAVAHGLAERFPDTNAGWDAELVPLREQIVGDVRPALLVFMGAVGLVLLIACANVANLVLARIAARERELTIRAALGASRGRLLRQVLTESLVLALAGAAVGVLLAVWGVQALRLADPGAIPRLEEIGVNGRALGFALSLGVLTGVGFGLLPALRVSRTGLTAGSRGVTGGAGVRSVRGGLVLAEVAIAFVLLVGAGLLIRSFDRLLRVAPGFEAEGVLTARLILPQAKYTEPERQAGMYGELLDRLRASPGVRSAGLVSDAPLGDGASYESFVIADAPQVAAGDVQDAERFGATPGYFAALRIPLVSGRPLDERDDARAPLVAVINQAMARRYWRGADPVGARITFGDPADSTSPWWTIVGVVADVRHDALDREPYPQTYLPLAQAPIRSMVLTLRTAGDPAEAAGPVRRALAELDPDVPLTDVRTMTERVADSVARPRVSAMLLGLFALTALLLAAIGIYGVIAYGVAQRTRELGIRMALGARAGDVLGLVVRQGMAPVLVGMLLGLGGAVVGSRLLRGLLFGVGSTDPVTYVGVAVFLAGVALLASYLPARRAALADPVAALRAE